MSPALAGGFLTTAPPGMTPTPLYFFSHFGILYFMDEVWLFRQFHICEPVITSIFALSSDAKIIILVVVSLYLLETTLINKFFKV